MWINEVCLVVLAVVTVMLMAVGLFAMFYLSKQQDNAEVSMDVVGTGFILFLLGLAGLIAFINLVPTIFTMVVP